MIRSPRVRSTMRAFAALVVVGTVAAACGPQTASAPKTTATATSTPSCPPNATTSTIFNLTNGARQSSGVPGLRWNGQLGCLAQDWSQHMAATGVMTHRDLSATLRSPGYSTYRTLGENILHGPGSMSAQQMHDAWMASPDHRANILNGAFTSMGIGVAYARGEVWATEDFGG